MNLFNKLRYFAMRKLQNPSVRNFIASKQAEAIGTATYADNNNVVLKVNTNVDEIVEDINTLGYHTLNAKLDDKIIESIILKSKTLKCLDPYNKLYNFSLDAIPEKTQVANFYPHDLMGIPEIAQLGNDPTILNVAAKFLGCKPTLSSVNMWWSLPDKKSAEAAQNFHRDVDDFKFIKIFVYLTDVTMDSGPHVYIEGSSLSTKYRRMGRFSDLEIENAFGKDKVKYFVEPKGSIFFVDTYGIHKGLLPDGKERLLLQFEYSINPILAYNYKKSAPAITNYDHYVNRLFY